MISDMNIANLLEIDLHTSSANGHHIDQDQHHNQRSHSPIEKFLDLDDIDVNPLDCYRQAASQTSLTSSTTDLVNSVAPTTTATTTTTTATTTTKVTTPSTTSVQTVNNNQKTYLDEFNFQFSVCSASLSSASSSSSGFSEPSNFSTSSNLSSCSNNSNKGFTMQQQQSIDSCLFQSPNDSPVVNANNGNVYQSMSSQQTPSTNDTSLPTFKVNNSNNSNSNTSNCWSMIEFNSSNGEALKSSVNNLMSSNGNQFLLQHLNMDGGFSGGSVLGSDLLGQGHFGANSSSSNSESLFGGFSFFNDEIKLEIQ